MAVMAFAALLALLLVNWPHWWIAFLILSTFSTTPAFIPSQITIGGFNVFPHEIGLILGAAYVLLVRPRSANDWWAAAIGLVTAVGALNGYFSGYDVPAIANDTRGLFSLSLVVLIVGRIAFSPDAVIALKAIKLTLWSSFLLVAMGGLNLVELNARAEDASLSGQGLGGPSEVTRILVPTTHLASVTVAISLSLWIVKPDLFRRVAPFLLPALGITLLGFSRNGLVLIAVAVLTAPLFGSMLGGGVATGAALRMLGASLAGVGLYVSVGMLLYLGSGYPGLSYLQSMHSAYSNRVIAGLGSGVRQFDQATLYRQGETELLQRAIAGHEFFGWGFGYRYRVTAGRGFAVTSGSYFAHNFYWWAAAKVGWTGLLAYSAAFASGIGNAIFGPGRFPLRSAAGASLVGMLVTSSVTPLSTVSAAPVFGTLLGIALLRRPFFGYDGLGSECRTPEEVPLLAVRPSRPSPTR